MGRHGVTLNCTTEIRAELERRSKSRKEAHHRVERAKIILEVLGGKLQKDVAQELEVEPNTVSKWVRRFSKEGLPGLEDSYRSGKPKTVGKGIHLRIRG